MESWVGVHRERQILPFAPETFTRWWKRRGTAQVPASAKRKVALFGSCLINYQATDVGKATIQVLEKNGVHVVIPAQQCCGMPSFDIGDTAAIQKAAKSNLAAFLPWVEAGYEIVVPVPSCSLMWKREYPELIGGAETQRVAERTFDVCEYLMRLKKEGALLPTLRRSQGVWRTRCPAICETRTSDSSPKN